MLAVATVLALVIGAGTPAAARTPNDGLDGHNRAQEGIQPALDAMVAAGAPGVVARVDDRDGVWRGRSGVADLDRPGPPPAGARFRIASLTKSVVATIVLQLAERGRVRLDEPIEERLPGVVPRGERITVRQLLRHTSGLADYVSHPEFDDPAAYAEKTYTPRQLVAYGAELDPVAEPGERFAYSNTGYIVLGLLIERVTGSPLEREIRDRVLRPARMTHSSLPLTERRLHGPHATGYYLPAGADPDSPGALRELTELNPSFAWAAYGMVSDARDVNRFYRALFSGRLVDSASLAQMRDGVETPMAPVFPHYGLGLESVGLSCGELWGATGAIPGYETFAFADASGERRMTISINVHRTDPDAGRMLMAGVDALNRYFCGEPYPSPSAAASSKPDSRNVRLSRPLDIPIPAGPVPGNVFGTP